MIALTFISILNANLSLICELLYFFPALKDFQCKRENFKLHCRGTINEKAEKFLIVRTRCEDKHTNRLHFHKLE